MVITECIYILITIVVGLIMLITGCTDHLNTSIVGVNCGTEWVKIV